MTEKVRVLKDLIKNRRSIFPASYLQKPIDKTIILEILESANYAPTHKLTEPWRFIVFNGDRKIELGNQIAELYKANVSTDKFLQKKYDSMRIKCEQAACVVAINVQLHPDKLPEWEEIAAVGCAVQNMALTAEAFGIGAYWSSPGIINKIDGYFVLKENERCLGFFYMGYHETISRNAIRGPIEDKIRWF